MVLTGLFLVYADEQWEPSERPELRDHDEGVVPEAGGQWVALDGDVVSRSAEWIDP